MSLITDNTENQVEVVPLHGDHGDEYGFYCLGWVDKEAFVKAVDTHRGVGSSVNPSNVKHLYGHMTPVQGRAYDMAFTTSPSPRKSFYPVTFIELI